MQLEPQRDQRKGSIVKKGVGGGLRERERERGKEKRRDRRDKQGCKRAQQQNNSNNNGATVRGELRVPRGKCNTLSIE